jgi:hypothetical protein
VGDFSKTKAKSWKKKSESEIKQQKKAKRA